MADIDDLVSLMEQQNALIMNQNGLLRETLRQNTPATRPRMFTITVSLFDSFTSVAQVSSDVKKWSITNPGFQRLRYSFTGEIGDGQENVLLPGTRLPFDTAVNNFFIRLDESGTGPAELILETWTWEDFSSVEMEGEPLMPQSGVRSKRRPGSDFRGIGPQQVIKVVGKSEVTAQPGVSRAKQLRQRRAKRIQIREEEEEPEVIGPPAYIETG